VFAKFGRKGQKWLDDRMAVLPLISSLTLPHCRGKFWRDRTQTQAGEHRSVLQVRWGCVVA
jgi:hypothetical protein